jgi:FlaA1/EpsC-like NDP-sugar epimerase
MFKVNGFRPSTGWLLGFMDSFLMLTGMFLGSYFRFSGDIGFFYYDNYLVLRVMLVVLVTQVSFYYFELYDSKIFKERKKMGILLLGALVATSVILAVIYYMIPFLTVGRGILAISLFLILIFTFLWRVFYSYSLKAWASKEKILIIGTGELAKKVKSEILDNGYEGFEIVGFIDENRDKIGRRI